jgi:hypothetical protein
VTGLRTIVFLTFLALYVMTYIAFRVTHIETWEKDHNRYLIFPADAGVGAALYEFWRPLSYADEQITGVKSSVGPHDAPLSTSRKTAKLPS